MYIYVNWYVIFIFYISALDSSTSVTIVEECRVTPASSLPLTSLPLTVFDVVWLRFPAVKQIIFYQLTGLTRTHFDSVILPNLKRSLSLTLVHFFPLAGRLVWSPHDPKPSIIYSPGDDESFVSLVVAVSNEPESFLRLAGSEPRQVAESHLYTPELRVTDSEAAVISVKVTLFPNHGVAVATSGHHAVLDGKSAALFLKAWAHMNRQCSNSAASLLPPELAPSLDRSVVQGPEAIYGNLLKRWSEVGSSTSENPRSLQPIPPPALDPTLVRANFELSPDEVRTLRELALSKLGPMHLSTFVFAVSYTMSCMVKAKDIKKSSCPDQMILCSFVGNCRARMDPPLLENYFANCVTCLFFQLNAEALKGEDGFAVASRSVGDRIKEMGNQSVDQVLEEHIIEPAPAGLAIGVAGWPSLGFYEVDFGWGRPAKVDTTIDANGSISVAERRDGRGGVEIGLALTKDEMDLFASFFSAGLKPSST